MNGNSIKTFLAFALLVGVASQANANQRDHIDEMALIIQAKSTLLTTEVSHYRHTARYGQLIAGTHQLKALATHLHTIAHFSNNLNQLRHDVNELDRVFHRVENMFDQVERDASIGVGRIKGNTAHVKALLNAIEDCIHHLQDDIRTLSRAAAFCPTRQRHTSGFGYRPYGGNQFGGNQFGGVPIRSNPFIGNQFGGNAFDRHGALQSFDRGHRGHGNNRNRGGFGISIGGGSSRITFGF